MITKRLWRVLVVLVVLSGCASAQQPTLDALPPTADPATALARITFRNGTVETIGQSDLDQYSQILSGLSGQGTPPPDLALNLLIQRKLMLYLARTTDTVASPEQIERVVTNVTNGPFCNQAVQRTTNDNRVFLDECARAYGFADGTAFRNFIAEELSINDVSAAQAPKDLFRVAHILTEDYEQAAAAYDRVLRAPARFGDVAREVSIDPGSREEGGALLPFDAQGFTDVPPGERPDQFGTEFVSNTVALRPQFEQTGEAISQPFLVQTDVYTGWHIIKLEGLEASTQRQNSSAQQFRGAVFERALQAQTGDLNEPDTGDVPLLGVVEILANFPTPSVPPLEPVPSLEPSPSPEETVEPELLVPEATPEGGGGGESSPPAGTPTP